MTRTPPKRESREDTDAMRATGGQSAEGPKRSKNGASRSARGYEIRKRKKAEEEHSLEQTGIESGPRRPSRRTFVNCC